MNNLKNNCIEYDFAIEQYSTEGFSHHSYFVRSGDEAIVIDPITEPCLYLTLLNETLTTLKYVFLTHRSIDFVSGCEQLSKLTGAIVIQSNAQVNDNTTYNIGHITLSIIKTPGFTSDSCCYLLTNSKKVNRAVFTGGLILYGDIGKPIQSLPNRPSSTIDELFNSINSITTLAKDNCKMLFYPSYSEGAFFNPSIQENSSPYLMEQIKTNRYLSMDKDLFIQEVSKFSLVQAKYYIQNIQKASMTVNVKQLIDNIPKLNVDDVEQHIKNREVYVIDTRDQPNSSKGYIPNSIIASLKINFNKFVPSLLSTDIKIIIVTEPNMLRESIISFIRLGYQNILGYLHGGYPEWEKAGKPQSKIVYEQCSELASILQKGGKVIDVREKGEFKSDGVIKESILIPLTELAERIKEVPISNVLYVLCKSGARATLVSTYLTKAGNKSKMIVLMGGWMKLKSNGYPFINFP